MAKPFFMGVPLNEGKTKRRFLRGRYKPDFLRVMEACYQKNLWARFCQLPAADQENPALVEAMRHYDHTVNISWVMAHYRAAEKYLDSKDQTVAATGGSEWKKYMLPQYQRRIFFPELWSRAELDHWGGNI